MMTKENNNFFSNRTGLIFTLSILLLSLITTHFYNGQFPTFYEAKVVLKLNTTDENVAMAFPAVAEALVYDKEFLEQMKLECRFSPGSKKAMESIKLVNQSPGTAIFSTTASKASKLEEINTALASLMEEFVLEQVKENQEQEKKTIKEKLESLSKNLEETEQELKALASKASKQEPEQQVQAFISNTEKIELELNIQQLKEKINIATQKLRGTPKTTTTYSQRKKENPKVVERLARAEEELAKLFRVYKEKHPRVIEKQKQIKALKAQLGPRGGARAVTAANPLYERLERSIAGDGRRLAEFKGRLEELESAEKPVVEVPVAEDGAEAREALAARFKLANKFETLMGLKSEAQNQLEILEIKQRTLTYGVQSSLQERGQFVRMGTGERFNYGLSLSLALLFSLVFWFVPGKVGAAWAQGKGARRVSAAELGLELDLEQELELDFEQELEPVAEAGGEAESLVGGLEAEPKAETDLALEPEADPEAITEPAMAQEAEAAAEPVEAINAEEAKEATKATETPVKTEATAEITEQTQAQEPEEKPSILGKTLAPERLEFKFPEKATIHDGRLFMLNEPQSDLSQQYQKLCNGLQILTVTDGERIFMPLSPSQGIGKSTFICNSAIALAQRGYQTLIIDLNHQNPSVHKIFDLPNKLGVTDVMAEASIVEATQRAEVPNVPDLFVLSLGSQPEPLTELSEERLRGKLAEILKIARRRADLIFIDSPALSAHPKLFRALATMGNGSFIYLESENSEKAHLDEMSAVISELSLAVSAHLKL
jgi:Mrp family chromosome partitioning ATPase